MHTLPSILTGQSSSPARSTSGRSPLPRMSTPVTQPFALTPISSGASSTPASNVATITPPTGQSTNFTQTPPSSARLPLPEYGAFEGFSPASVASPDDRRPNPLEALRLQFLRQQEQGRQQQEPQAPVRTPNHPHNAFNQLMAQQGQQQQGQHTPPAAHVRTPNHPNNAFNRFMEQSPLPPETPAPITTTLKTFK